MPQSIDSLRVLEYWEKNLRDASQTEPRLIRPSKAFEDKALAKEYHVVTSDTEAAQQDDIPKDKVVPVVISDFDIDSDRIDDDDKINEINEMFDLLNGPNRYNERRILISPFKILKKGKKSADPNPNAYHYPLWIPARIEDDGYLIVPQYGCPRIARKYLSPNEDQKKDSFAIGSAKQYDELLSNFSERFDSYRQYIVEIESLFYTLTNQRIDEIRIIEDRDIIHDATIVVDDGISTAHNIIRLYKYLINEFSADNLPFLLKSFINGHLGEKTESINKDDFTQYDSVIKGDMVGEKELSDSQRSALYSWLTATHNQRVLAITGPPGTGKTYLLQNLVATGIINAALNDSDGKHEPAIYIACAMSNQAVKNVLKELLAYQESRWIKSPQEAVQLGGGVFLVPKSSSKQAESFLYIQNFSDGPIKECENTEFVREAKEDFLKKFKEKYPNYSSETLSIIEAVDCLHYELELNEKILPDFEKDDSSRATRHRGTLFGIAVHYWEGVWLLEAEKHIDKRITTKEDLVQYWKWRAMLTPCFAGTFHTIPDVFVYKELQDDGTIQYDYLTELADTIIVDEAGQVCPEIGGPSFCFAKKALVLGDANQIQPIWDIPEGIDKGNMKINCLDEDTYELFRNRGIASSTGSIMQIAQNASWIKSTSTHTSIDGAFLREHYRCYDEIIQFCNQLCYNGMIINCVKGLNGTPSSPFDGTPTCGEPLPPMQIIPINGASENLIGRSCFNLNECYAIRRWIENNANIIENAYHILFQDAISIITPYRAQVTQIRKLLLGEGARNDNKFKGLKNLLYTDENGEKHEITVGTVHSMQGSQRPVILFSSVVDSNNNLDFIDKNMLNVAVSRARNSFVLFMNPSLFGQKREEPLCKLKQYYDDLVQKHPEYALKDNIDITEHPENYRWTIRVFISYRHSDRDLAKKIRDYLVNKGYNERALFWDEDSLDGGDVFPQKITNAIQECKDFILLYSADSAQRCKEKGDWVAREIREALKANCRIIPVIIDQSVPDWTWLQEEDSAGEKTLQELHCLRHLMEDGENSVEKLGEKIMDALKAD